MSKLSTMEELLDGVVVESKTLGWIGDVRMCKRILKKQTTDMGEIPFFKIGTFGRKPNSFISRETFEEYRDKYNYPKTGEVLISASGTIGRTVIFDGEEAYFQDSNIVWIENDESKVLNKYLFHFYKIANWNISDGGVIRRLYNDNIKKTSIPIPCPENPNKSLEIQVEIVRILDTFTELTTTLTTELTARKKQYNYYRDQLLSFEEGKVEWETLGDVCESISSGKNKDKSDDGLYPVFGSTGIIGRTNHKAYEVELILVARVGANAGRVNIAQGEYDVSDNTLILLAKKNINIKYLYYYLVNLNLNRFTKGAGQPLLTAGQLKKMTVPIPLPEDQARIVSILDKFDVLTNSISEGLPREIELRQKQYEYYRDLLLSFPKPDSEVAA